MNIYNVIYASADEFSNITIENIEQFTDKEKAEECFNKRKDSIKEIMDEASGSYDVSDTKWCYSVNREDGSDGMNVTIIQTCPSVKVDINMN